MSEYSVGGDKELTLQDALEYIHMSLAEFNELRAKNGMRRGQLWLIQLSSKDYVKLVWSPYDPHHSDNWSDILRALRFLLEN